MSHRGHMGNLRDSDSLQMSCLGMKQISFNTIKRCKMCGTIAIVRLYNCVCCSYRCCCYSHCSVPVVVAFVAVFLAAAAAAVVVVVVVVAITVATLLLLLLLQPLLF